MRIKQITPQKRDHTHDHYIKQLIYHPHFSIIHPQSSNTTFPTSFDPVTSIFTHIFFHLTSITHLLAYHNHKLFCINGNCIYILDPVSHRKSQCYLSHTNHLTPPSCNHILDHKTFTIAHTKCCPPSIWHNKHPLIITKLIKTTLYLVYDCKSQEASWISNLSVHWKPKCKQYHKHFFQICYEKNNPPQHSN